MKHTIAIFILLINCCCNIVIAQAPNWLWAESVGGSNLEIGRSIATDVSGNVIAIGYFNSPTINFGTTTLTNTSGWSDLFIIKYDTMGNVIWAKSAGGSLDDYGFSVITDIHGNIFVLGYFLSPTIIFGTTTLFNSGNGKADFFIVKYDINGNVIWAKSGGGLDDDYAYCVSADLNGNTIITGLFKSDSVFLGTTTLVNSNNSGGPEDIFIVKYDTNGNVLWAKSAGGNDFDEGNGVSTDVNGDIFVTGDFRSSSITFGSYTLINSGTEPDIFIVKYDASGNVIWAVNTGGNTFANAKSITTDTSGNVFITGEFSSPSITFGATTLINAGSNDVFIVKYDSSGNVLWAKNTGGTNNEYGINVSTDTNGNVFMTGYFRSTVITFGTTSLYNAGGWDFYIVKYDTWGNVVWAISAGGPLNDASLGASINAAGNVYITGYFQSSSIAFGTTTITKAGGYDSFVAKLDTAFISGIAEQFHQSYLTIAPNPFTCQTTLTFNKEQKNTTIKISDVLGNKVKTITFSGKQVVIEKGTMKPGIYLVQATDENKNVANKKIVIQ